MSVKIEHCVNRRGYPLTGRAITTADPPLEITILNFSVVFGAVANTNLTLLLAVYTSTLTNSSTVSASGSITFSSKEKPSKS